eukprot:2371152-Rhodomonas_salina.1
MSVPDIAYVAGVHEDSRDLRRYETCMQKRGWTPADTHPQTPRQSYSMPKAVQRACGSQGGTTGERQRGERERGKEGKRDGRWKERRGVAGKGGGKGEETAEAVIGSERAAETDDEGRGEEAKGGSERARAKAGPARVSGERMCVVSHSVGDN